jgi:hypothetical protein
VANGDRVKIYPDAAHGFLFQHHADVARDVDAFLTEYAPGSRPGSSLARRWNDSANLVRTTHNLERRF